jgi:Annexin
VSTLKSELSGKFEDVIVACMMPLEQYYAKELHSAMVGLGTNEHTLIEILCSVNNAQMQAIKTCYLQSNYFDNFSHFIFLFSRLCYFWAVRGFLIKVCSFH